MKKYNINNNRPELDDKSIEGHKDFGSIFQKYSAMQPNQSMLQKGWFKGGLATVTIAVSSYIAYKSELFSQSKHKTNEETVQNIIAPPIKTIDVNFDNYTIDAKNGDTLKHSSGTTIIFPADCFVDENSNVINDNVQITYREFHNVCDVLLSGIPMAYDSAGVKNQFQSAGMFELRGSYQNKNITFAEGKSAIVHMVSDYDGGFNFYSMNDTTGSWTYITSANPTPNPEKIKLKRELDELPQLPEKPILTEDNEPVFDVEYDTQRFPELSDFKNVVWKYKQVDTFKTFDENKWIFEEKWTRLNLEKYEADNYTYLLALASADKNIKVPVTIALKGRNYKVATKKYEEKLSKLSSVLNKINDTQNAYEGTKEFVRSFPVSNLGVCNWDKIFTSLEIAAQNINFKITDDNSFNTDNIKKYLVVPDANVVLPFYSKNDSSSTNISNKYKFAYVIILSNNEVAISDYFDSKEALLNMDKNGTIVLELKKFKVSTIGYDDIKSLLIPKTKPSFI